MPARFVVQNDERQLTPVKAIAASPDVQLSGTVLLVEDNIMIALEAEDVLLALGAEDVLVASNVGEALRHLTITTPSFALLDINLGSEVSWPIALRLRELNVRYAFATGYGDTINVPIEHREALIVAKPYTQDSLSRVIHVREAIAHG